MELVKQLHFSLPVFAGCSENVLEKKMTEVSYFLDMLRSASASEHETSKAAQTSHGEWKVCTLNHLFIFFQK